MRLAVNWGVLVLAVATVLALRHQGQASARAPLPPPAAHLGAAADRQWQSFQTYRGAVPVLLYHGINSAGAGLSVTPQDFAEQMRALRTAGFHAITLSQYISFVHGAWRSLPSKPVLLTFDDGRLTDYRAANNILREYGFHATMFVFAAGPSVNPGFSLSWDELQAMRASGTWAIGEYGGNGPEYVVYNAAGSRGSPYAFLRYYPSASGGHLEGFTSFAARATSSILWGQRQFAAHGHGLQPLAFALPYTSFSATQTNDPLIPKFLFPWLKQHFPVVFGGDYLVRAGDARTQGVKRFTPAASYRISVTSRTSLAELYCRLADWTRGRPIRDEYKCLRLGQGAGNAHAQRRGHLAQPPMG